MVMSSDSMGVSTASTNARASSSVMAGFAVPPTREIDSFPRGQPELSRLHGGLDVKTRAVGARSHDGGRAPRW